MGGKTKTKSDSTTSLLPGQQRNVDSLLTGALNQYNQGPLQYYQGDAVAGINPSIQGAWDNLLASGQGAGAQGIQQAIGANNAYLDPNFIQDPTSAPGYAAMAGDLERRASTNFLEGIAPELRGGAILNGMYGGSKQGIGMGLGAARVQDQLAGQLGGLQQNVWSQMLQAQGNAIGRAPGLYEASLRPDQIGLDVGMMQRAYEQQVMDEAIRKWNFEQQAPLTNLMMLKELTGNISDYGQRTQSKSETRETPGAMQALGTAAMVGSMFTPFGPVAAGMGGLSGVGGALAGGGSLGGGLIGQSMQGGAGNFWTNPNMPGIGRT